MVLENKGKFVLTKKGKTGIVYIPADLVKDSQFPLKVGKIKIRIEGQSIIIQSEN